MLALANEPICSSNLQLYGNSSYDEYINFMPDFWDVVEVCT